MANTFKDWEPRKQFMTLLLCYFAIPVLQGAMALLGGFIHYLPYAWQEFLTTNAVWIGALFKACTLLVLVALFCIKVCGTNRKYKIGLVLLIADVIISLVTDAVGGASIPRFPLSIFKIALSLAGLILFISGSPVDRKVKIFVICTPFLVTLVYGIVLLQSIQSQHFNLATAGALFLLQSVVFVTLLFLLRKQTSDL